MLCRKKIRVASIHYGMLCEISVRLYAAVQAAGCRARTHIQFTYIINVNHTSPPTAAEKAKEMDIS